MIGRLLRRFRAGETHLASQHPAVRNAPASITVTSPAWVPGGAMPQRLAGPGVGDDVAPALGWTGVPEGTAELVLIVEDPSVPLPRPAVHAVLTAIPADRAGLDEERWDTAPARFGRNSLRQRSYSGPRPIPGHGSHTYAFQLFAADRPLVLPAEATKAAALAALEGHVLARGRLDGTYER